MSELPVGTRVTYDDEPDPPQIVGVIAEPTAEELAYAETFGGGGPADGDVLVRWSQQERWDSSWVQPEDLRVVDTKQRLAELRKRRPRRVDPMPGVPETAEYAARQAAELEPVRRMQMLPDDRCEECGAPGEALVPDDPHDPWILCPAHTDELAAQLKEAEDGPLYSLDEVLADSDYTPMRWWNVIRQVRAHWAALGHIWVHNGPLWWLCSTCRSWRREDQL